jgi:hypothetical protein
MTSQYIKFPLSVAVALYVSVLLTQKIIALCIISTLYGLLVSSRHIGQSAV